MTSEEYEADVRMLVESRAALLRHEELLFRLMGCGRAAHARYELAAARLSLHAARDVLLLAAEKVALGEQVGPPGGRRGTKGDEQ
jgi:hypothetical protein